MHIVLDCAFLMLEAVVAVPAGADLLSPHCELHRLQTPLLQHLEGLAQNMLRGHPPGTAGYAENHDGIWVVKIFQICLDGVLWARE